MYKTIFKYELKYWLRQPAIYLYAALLFGIAFTVMTGMAAESTDRFNGKMVNSPIFLYDMTRRFFILIILLLPVIYGLSAFRDFSHNVHHLLYAYPFVKKDYVLAKWASASVVFWGISLSLGLGFWMGSQMPWTNAALVMPTTFSSYLYLYGVFLLPNIFLVSLVVFGAVLLTRNIYTGFIISFLLILVPQITGVFFEESSQQWWAAFFDPFGTKAIAYYTHNWTVAEQNQLTLPLQDLVLYNRLFWMGIGLLLARIIYQKFEFHQRAYSFSFKPTNGTKLAIPNFSKIITIQLSKVNYAYHFPQQLAACWRMAIMDFNAIWRSKSFICLVLGGLIFVLIIMSSVNPRWETETLPMTWQMLELPSMFYAGVINAITFLYAGLLIHRQRKYQIQQLTDVCPMPNWVFLGSKVLALIKIQVVLLAIVMLGGIASQISKGFYQFEIGQYLFNLYGLNLIHYVIWALLAVFFHTLIYRPFIGFILLLLLPVGFIGLAEFGPTFLGLDFLEQYQFRYNQAPGDVFGVRYSDMDGYGAMLAPYFMYKFYWLLAGIVLLLIALLFYVRGLPQSFKERIAIAKKRFAGKLAIGLSLAVIAFISLGAFLYSENNIKNEYFTKQEKRALFSKAEERYKKYEYFNQPKIVDVAINMDIFPSKRQFKAKGNYWLINPSKTPIDTLLINYLPNLNTTYHFNRNTQIVRKDAIANLAHFDILVLETPLLAGDSLQMTFENHSPPMTLLHTNEYVKSNGTYIQDDVFPRFGNWLSFFKSHYQLGKDNNRSHPSDTTAHRHSFMAKDADRVHFEAIVSTDKDQIALAPGELLEEWEEDNRRYFHYKMSRKIALSYLFTSGKYQVKRDKWKGVDLEIYYDKKHPYNIDRMMQGLKAGLDYCTENFSPYQFKQVRIVEFSQIGGASAHGFPGIIPAGEGAGFIAAIDDSEGKGVDYAFGTAVHELAHQWWGHQVLPADVLGTKLVVESLSDYTNVKVKEHTKGIEEARQFLKNNLKTYLSLRTKDRRDESPIMYAYPDQNYIFYLKGTAILYALSDFIGEKRLNKAIQGYVEKVAFQENQYTTSIEFVNHIRAVVPDSFQYLIKDMFETVTLYDNRMQHAEVQPLANGKFQIDLDVIISKYRSGQQGRPIYEELENTALYYEPKAKETAIQSLPLADYLEVGIFDKNGKELYVQKHKFTQIHNQFSIILAEKPAKVSIDPYWKMIDKDESDNTLELE